MLTLGPVPEALDVNMTLGCSASIQNAAQCGESSGFRVQGTDEQLPISPGFPHCSNYYRYVLCWIVSAAVLREPEERTSTAELGTSGL